jgi:hypothetical protein
MYAESHRVCQHAPGLARLYTLLAEATAQVLLAKVIVGCEATDYYGLNPSLWADLVTQSGDVKQHIISILDRTFAEFAACFSDLCGLKARTVMNLVRQLARR